MLVPWGRVSNVLELLHGSPSAGHFGIDKTYKRACERFYWPCMRRDVRNWIESSEICLRRKDTIIDRQKHSLTNEKAKKKATEKCLLEIRNKNVLNRPATLYEILFCLKSSASKDQIKKHYHKMSLLTHPDAGGDEEFFKTINRAYQILMKDGCKKLKTISGCTMHRKS